MKLVDADGNYIWDLSPKTGMRIYDLYGTMQGRIRGRDQLLYSSNTSGLDIYSSSQIVISAPRLRFTNYMRIDNSNGKAGLNEDSYGLALFNQGNNSNCFVRVNPGGTITISASAVYSDSPIYVNGYKAVTRDDLAVYTDGTIKWVGA